jgi:hypothetical protein
MKAKQPCPDCNDTGVLKLAGFERPVPCYCGATGENRVAKPKDKPVDSKTPRYFRGAKLRNT